MPMLGVHNKIPVTQQAEHFVQAKIEKPNCTVVMQTRDAQLSVSSACDPIWLAKLLKGLAA
jgi:hypothetical protein